MNWLVGRGVQHFRHKHRFPASEAGLQRAQLWYHRYGKWSLLLSWMPIIGDPLTVAAGVMKEPLTHFVLQVAVAKATRYLAVAAVALNWA